MSSFSEIHNIVLNASLDDNNESTIVLKPTQGHNKKIKHYTTLKAIQQNMQESSGQKNTVLDNYIDPNDGIFLQLKWKYSIKEIGEYTYYYLSMKSLDIKLNIIKKNNNSSIYVFLKYTDGCQYLAAIILDKYLNNHWKIENY